MTFQRLRKPPQEELLAIYNEAVPLAAYDAEARDNQKYWAAAMLDAHRNKDEGRLATAYQLSLSLKEAVRSCLETGYQAARVPWSKMGDTQDNYPPQDGDYLRRMVVAPWPSAMDPSPAYGHPRVSLPREEPPKPKVFWPAPEVIWPTIVQVESNRRWSLGALGLAMLMRRLLRPEDTATDAKQTGRANLLFDYIEKPGELPKGHTVITTLETARSLVDETPLLGWHRDGELYLEIEPADPSVALMEGLVARGIAVNFNDMVQIRPLVAARPWTSPSFDPLAANVRAQRGQ